MRLIILSSFVLAAIAAPLAGAQSTSELYRLESRLDGFDVGDELGVSFACAGDVNGDGVADLVVGAPYRSNPGVNRGGSAFVFSGADGSVLLELKGETDNGLLGFSVSGAGDVDGDGMDDIIVGVPSADPPNKPVHAGSAVVVSVASGALLWRFDGGKFFDQLGTSVSGAGDVDGDGFPDLLVGAPFMDPGGALNAGSAILYSGASGAELGSFHGTTDGANLGYSVSGAGDVNGDGFGDIVIGAPRAQPGGAVFAGSAFVLGGGPGGVLYQFDGAANDQLGLSVSGVGDVNGDGFDDVIIGVPFADPGGLGDAGSARVLSGADGSLLWELAGAVAGEQFGTAVGGAGDADADGVPDLVVGAPYADPGALADAGSAFLYSGASGSLLTRFDGAEAGMRLGFALDGACDQDGDGRDEILISAPFADAGALLDSGSAFVFQRHPFLDLTSGQLSASLGGSVDFLMDFPSSEAGQPYQILASLSGTGPTSLGGLEIPLTRDFLFNRTLRKNYPSKASNFAGNLDAAGGAVANVTTAPGDLPATSIGRIYYLAAVTANYPSVARTLVVVP